MRTILSLLALLTLAATAEAGPLRRRAAIRHQSRTVTETTPYGTTVKTSERTVMRGNPEAFGDALDQVNAMRASRGMPAYIRDDGLTQAAIAAASHRATYGIAGHTSNDFAFLPAGSSASAAGCGAMDASWGFRACTVYEHWTYAGAATALGSDGRLYHHIFVR